MNTTLTRNDQWNAFTGAIHENPLDATTRLVYADFLKDHDAPEEEALQRQYAAAIQAFPFWTTLGAVRLDSVPVFHVPRSLPRKEQAALARQLFRRLGLKGVSVTTPNYSMARVVDVHNPEPAHPGWLGSEQWQHESYADIPESVPARMASLLRYHAAERVKMLLGHAFPSHDDRSDSQTDYFAACWSVD